jgi:hypothetical protein
MNPVTPAALPNTVEVTFAKDQPEYIPLPARVDEHGVVTTEWKPSVEELQTLLRGGRVRLSMWSRVHIGVPLTPVMIEAVDSVQ